MSIDRTYSCLSVGEFVDRANWLGISPRLVTEVQELSRSVIQLKQTLVVWQSLTAQEFWQLSNWSGDGVVDIGASQTTSVEHGTLSTTMKTEEFWRCFNWSYQNIARSNSTAIVEEVAIGGNEEFTIENLSQLF